MQIDVTIKDHTADVLEAVNDKIKLALAAMGEVIEGHAKEECPVDTGLLRNSITYAVAGGAPSISEYHADRTSTGQSATSGTSGSVVIGRYSGIIGDASENAVYVGSNVEYAPAVEFRDIPHNVGQAHFLRDGAQNHIPELKDKAEKILSAI